MYPAIFLLGEESVYITTVMSRRVTAALNHIINRNQPHPRENESPEQKSRSVSRAQGHISTNTCLFSDNTCSESQIKAGRTLSIKSSALGCEGRHNFPGMFMRR